MLTKSEFMQFVQCPKQLWLQKHRKEFGVENSEALQRIFDEGYFIESYAYKLFPNGVVACEGDYKSVEAIEKSRELMAKKTPVIFQPTISSANLFCRADIIELSEDGESWNIYEVKSTTKVKDEQIRDVSFQKTCFEDAGYKIKKVYLICLNTKYVRHGEIDVKKLFEIEDVTEQVIFIGDSTKSKIPLALDMIKEKDEPNLRILKQCKNPHECPFLKYCWKDIPEKSIYAIGGGLPAPKLNMLLDKGILRIKDIPEGVITRPDQLLQYNAEKNDKVYIEKENIEKELAKLEYPLYFLDYETFGTAIPLFDGYSPYQRMIFQYSLHIQRTPDSEPEHYAYLAKGFKDPSRDLAKDLKEKIGDKGSVIAWFMSFEKGCNTEMGERYPEFAEFFRDVNERMFDLMQVFKKGYYVHKDFLGSASLKKVLPVFVPHLSYKGLDIQEGMTASNSWRDMIEPKMEKQKQDKIYDDLLKYCELDTLAMVEILKRLRKVVGE